MNACIASMLTLLGQTGPALNADSAAVQVQSVWDFVLKGGPMMIPIGVCSLVALAVFVERLITLRRCKVIPPDFLPALQSVMEKNGDDYAGALECCRRSGSPIANIFAAGIRSLGASVELVEKHIEQAGEREVFKLRKYLRMLALIASIAPLLGLLGTIFGMIDAFQTVAASGEALGRTESLAKGIYQAMITTAAGLMVAIPVLIGYHWLAGKIDRLVGEMDGMTVEFVEQHALARARRAGGVRRQVSKPAMRVALDARQMPPPQVAGGPEARTGSPSAVASSRA